VIKHEPCIFWFCTDSDVTPAQGGGCPAAKEWRVKEDYVNTVLRKDGTVVTITPTGHNYELAIDGEHRTIGPELAANPLGDPEFEAIVQELKSDLKRLAGKIAPVRKPSQRH
jgi:hypothetical protein